MRSSSLENKIYDILIDADLPFEEEYTSGVSSIEKEEKNVIMLV